MPASMMSDVTGSNLKVIGKQHRDGRRRADAGEHADHRAEEHTDEAPKQVGQGEGGDEAELEVGEELHRGVFRIGATVR